MADLAGLAVVAVVAAGGGSTGAALRFAAGLLSADLLAADLLAAGLRVRGAASLVGLAEVYPDGTASEADASTAAGVRRGRGAEERSDKTSLARQLCKP